MSHSCHAVLPLKREHFFLLKRRKHSNVADVRHWGQDRRLKHLAVRTRASGPEQQDKASAKGMHPPDKQFLFRLGRDFDDVLKIPYLRVAHNYKILTRHVILSCVLLR